MSGRKCFFFTTWPLRSLGALGRACPRAMRSHNVCSYLHNLFHMLLLQFFLGDIIHVTGTAHTRRLIVSTSESLFLEILPKREKEKKPLTWRFIWLETFFWGEHVLPEQEWFLLNGCPVSKVRQTHTSGFKSWIDATRLVAFQSS